MKPLSGALNEIKTSGISILLAEQDVTTVFELANREFVFESAKVILRGPTVGLADDQTFRKACMFI
jgi:ABC-type branched-subunit amino acid transport system ATPase component